MTEPMAAPPPQAPAPAYGGWGSRLGALILDAIPTTIVLVILTSLFGESSSSGGSASFQLTGFPALVYFVFAIGWFYYNWLLGQGTKGQTMGKKVLNIAVYGADGKPIGKGGTFVRQIAHILDAIPCLIGYLWPLWDKEKQTFADKITGTHVYKV